MTGIPMHINMMRWCILATTLLAGALILAGCANQANTATETVSYSYTDFPDRSIGDFAPASLDKARGAMAINAALYKDMFAAARREFDGSSGRYDITLTTLTETDGESEYRINIGGVALPTQQNPESSDDFSPHTLHWKNVWIRENDSVRIEFSSHTNKKIPEGEGTAYARGRWTKIEFTPAK